MFGSNRRLNEMQRQQLELRETARQLRQEQREQRDQDNQDPTTATPSSLYFPNRTNIDRISSGQNNSETIPLYVNGSGGILGSEGASPSAPVKTPSDADLPTYTEATKEEAPRDITKIV